MLSKRGDLSESSAAFISCSSYSGLTQNEVQFQVTRSSNTIKDADDCSSELSGTSNSTCLFRHSSRILRSYPTEGRTFDSVAHKDSDFNTENQEGLDTLNSNEDLNARTSAGIDTWNSENKEKQRSPVRAKRKKRTKKQSLNFLNRMIKNKRQLALAGEYKNMYTLLCTLIKQQQNAPIKSKKDRIRRRHLIKRIQSLFRILRKKLEKRDRLQRILMRKRVYRERQRKVHLRLKKILRVVYFKRQQRIQNMRDLRIRERRRLADNLMLQAAKLRARANRLTGGRDVKYTQRKTRKTSKTVIPKVESVAETVGDHNDERNSQIVIKVSMQQMPESRAKKSKKSRAKSRKPKSLGKSSIKAKALDGKLKNLNERMKTLLKKLSKFVKKKKNSKLSDNVSTMPTTVTINTTLNKKSARKRKSARVRDNEQERVEILNCSLIRTLFK